MPIHLFLWTRAPSSPVSRSDSGCPLLEGRRLGRPLGNMDLGTSSMPNFQGMKTHDPEPALLRIFPLRSTIPWILVF